MQDLNITDKVQRLDFCRQSCPTHCAYLNSYNFFFNASFYGSKPFDDDILLKNIEMKVFKDQ